MSGVCRKIYEEIYDEKWKIEILFGENETSQLIGIDQLKAI